MRSLDPQIPLDQVATLSQEVERSLWQERLLVVLISCFGLFSLLLAGIGIYGILAYFVGQKRQEIGVRIALGAQPHHVIRLMTRHVIPVLVTGVIAGAALSSAMSIWVRNLLYEVQPFDLASDAMAILLLAVIGMGGTAVPTFRAMRTNPAVALRQE